MKKLNSSGFMLAETLIVTTFVAGILIFLFIQFTNLGKAYDDSYIYNTTEGLYALEDIKEYINTDLDLLLYIEENIETMKYIDLTDCSLFTNENYCVNLFNLENIDRIFITTNTFDNKNITGYNEDFNIFIGKIIGEGSEKYRLVASFKNSMFATLRLGDSDE
ncbi:MAG: hypothetical protein IJE04_03135 [Bacilli bacterium]|nr:hypothetical protein [Bacilli bacterium]